MKNSVIETMPDYTACNAFPAGFEPYLSPSATIDSEHPDVVEFSKLRSAKSDGALAKAISLYHSVRDELRYDPYSIDMTESGLSASVTLASGKGWCVSKAVLLAAACRAIGIPARLGFADVKNHMSTENLRKSMGTNIFYWHGYADIYLNEKWVKATPAFNVELCEKFRIKTLEFDGLVDSIYHPYDIDGRQHMEYVNYRGEYADVPIAEMSADFAKYYPNLELGTKNLDFDSEVERETE